MPDGCGRTTHYGRSMSGMLAPLATAIRTWLKGPTLMADALFAGLIGVISLVEASSPEFATSAGADTFAYVTIVIAAASLIVRRHMPITVLVIVTTTLATFYLGDGVDFLSLLGLAPFYAVAAHSTQRRRAWVAMPSLTKGASTRTGCSRSGAAMRSCGPKMWGSRAGPSWFSASIPAGTR